MRNFRLGGLQRGGLVAAAIVIASMLWIEVDDNGLEDTNWLLPILAIVALLFIAAHGWAGFRQKSRAVDGYWNAPETEEDGPRAEAVRRARVRQAPRSASPRRSPLHDEYFAVVDRLGRFLKDALLSPSPALGRGFIQQSGGHIDIVALKLAFMLMLLRRERRHGGYAETNEVAELRLLAIGHATNAVMQDLRTLETQHPRPQRKEVLQTIADEIACCELAARETLNGLARQDRFPFDPILVIVNKELPLAGDTAHDRAEKYGREVQSITDAP